jgi:putative endonuclease
VKRKETGALGERLAADFLTKRGFQILETNFRCTEGEMDIVAMDRDTLVFGEVRTKTSRGFGSPEESISETKKAHLRAVAERYLESHNDLPTSWRIDVVAVELDRSGRCRRIELIENAIEGD